MDARRYLSKDRQRRVIPGRSRTPSARNTQGSRERLMRWWSRVLTAVKLLTAGALLGGLLLSLPGLWRWLDRPVARVEVSGSFHYLDKAQLQEQLKPYLAESFFSLDLRSIQAQLEADGWVENVRVRKVWPDLLKVGFREQVPVARWRHRQLINADGDVLAPRQGHDFSKLPLLSGPTGSEQEVMQQYLTLSHQVRALGLKLDGVTLSDAGSWSFRIGKVAVQVGGQALIKRMQRFSQLYFTRLKARWGDVERVDLRYRDGVAVAWKKSTADSG